MAAEIVELHKLKLAELKQECTARGLEAKGNKQDLINRLQAYLEEHAEEEANEEDVLGEETEEEEPKPVEPPVKVEEPPVKEADVGAEKKVVKITSEISQMERMQKRAERFNVPVSLESKKAARAARFGMSTVSTKGLSADSKPTVNMDKLKERAQRFGLNVSSLSKKMEPCRGQNPARPTPALCRDPRAVRSRPLRSLVPGRNVSPRRALSFVVTLAPGSRVHGLRSGFSH
ncbi:SAP domain-containing ribonucleoprotein isoform X1 [Alligator sinensis]|uniref:SAP domain-containing ribonucleoprotein n=1 Tax=Alligator sinensis TaxID=38654 RepID=A0A1U7S5S7_ALLSI|nr:SAP domain-containing ribonucleoprotein isoform X1 [Alligator sinensis]